MNIPVIKKGAKYLLKVNGIHSQESAKNLMEIWEQATGAKAVLISEFEIIAELESDTK